MEEAVGSMFAWLDGLVVMHKRIIVRWHWLVAVLMVGLLGISCSGPGAPAGEPTPENPAPTASPTVEDPSTEQSDELAFPAAGQLAVLGAEGNLLLFEQGQPPVALTDDADTSEAGGAVLYAHPTWSPAGWLSYARVEAADGTPSHLDVLARPPNAAEPITVLSADETTYVYGYWSPAPCPESAGCGRFAYLVNDGDRLAMRITAVQANGATSVEDHEVGRAAPFYYDWSPDGNQMLWYQYEETVRIYDVESDEFAETIDAQPGRFMAPAWSPVDDRLLLTERSGTRNQLAIVADGETTELDMPFEGFAFFDWSPDGERIAYTYGGDPLSPVTVLNADGSGRQVFDAVEDVVAFFWSPDGAKLAVISLVLAEDPLPMAGRTGRARPARQDPGDFEFLWSVIDVESGEATPLARFLPTADQWYMLRYFGQYTHSHRVWSADSRHLVYADQRGDPDQPVVLLLDTSEPGLAPIEIAEGTFGVFSFAD